ncbi:MAG: IclR family transcriptional regulator [Acidobacteriota bacterium]
MSRTKPPPGTQSVRRAIALLKAFTGDTPEMSLAELTEAVGLARTTAHRLLSALESEGLVARNAGGNAYRLGPAAIALGSRALRSNDLRAVARPYLAEMAETSGETATLAVLADRRVLIIDEVLSQHLLGTGPSIGTSYPLHVTATGKAILAAMDETRRGAVLPERLERIGPAAIEDPGELDADIRRTRRRGYAVAVEELEEGFAAVGAAIHDPTGEVTAAVSLGGPSTRLVDNLERLGELCREVAARISGSLGYES